MQQRCVIVGASPQNNLNNIREAISAENDYIICADGGYQVALAAGFVPDLYVGDGDSNSIPNHTDKIILPREKDNTDFQAAIDLGLLRGYKSFILVGCTGNRFDHYFANVCMLERLLAHGARGAIIDDNNVIQIHAGGEMILDPVPCRQYLSLIPLDSKVTGVTITGVKYPLHNVTLSREQPLGVSNEFTGDKAVLHTETGKLLVVYSND